MAKYRVVTSYDYLKNDNKRAVLHDYYGLTANLRNAIDAAREYMMLYCKDTRCSWATIRIYDDLDKQVCKYEYTYPYMHFNGGWRDIREVHKFYEFNSHNA